MGSEGGRGRPGAIPVRSRFRLGTIPVRSRFHPGSTPGDLGPFNPGLPVEVPVWLAINLKQRQKCRLIPPEWMDVGKLEEIRDQERKEDTFTPMPSPYYMELTKLLLNYASDNIPRADEIRTLVKDTWDTRVAKLRLSADSFVRQQEAHAKMEPGQGSATTRHCDTHHDPAGAEKAPESKEKG
ncbi:DNA replication complex GINS protein PSF2 isoform X3 [Taeniopygia guttata]|uniref:DNA replication complex GINS protein PSF2 isoform X3 n=1 Tax=Taeniopygia guttata TaxID=59729 RepID=UPI003BB8CCB3